MTEPKAVEGRRSKSAVGLDVGFSPVVVASATLVLAGVIALALVTTGLVLGGTTTPGITLIASGGLGIVVVLAAAGVVAGVVAGVHRRATNPDVTGGGPGTPPWAELACAIDRLGEQSALSDDARRVLNRQRERGLLTAAIEEDIAAQDWDAAMTLVKELADRFGYRAEAEEYRQRVDQIRAETVERQVGEAVSRLDGLIAQRRWEPAQVEAARIGRLYPDSPRVEGLRQRVDAARQTYKQDLERRFLFAAQNDRIEEAMELLKELDAYLTETEAGPFREVARGVIGKARDNLGVQFKIAVQDRRWDEAVEAGQRIVAQFPNSRMAGEVRTLLDSIRAKAAPAVGSAG